VALPKYTVAEMKELVHMLKLPVAPHINTEVPLLRHIITCVFPTADKAFADAIIALRRKAKEPREDDKDCMCAESENIELLEGMIDEDEMEAVEVFAKRWDELRVTAEDKKAARAAGGPHLDAADGHGVDDAEGGPGIDDIVGEGAFGPIPTKDSYTPEEARAWAPQLEGCTLTKD
jgi:hypothetical protein